MNRLIVVGLIAFVLAGCVGTSVPTVFDRDDAEESLNRHYTYPNVRIGKLFGINSEVLANTNMFPLAGNGWHHYQLNLEKNDSGFAMCTVHLKPSMKTGCLGLEYITLTRTLGLGVDDSELLRECRNAIGWVNDKIGTEMDLDALTDLNRLRAHHKCERNRCALTLCDTSVYADLADGQQVHVSGHDAVFMKRGYEYVEMAPASIEITFRVGESDCRQRLLIRRRFVEKDGNIVEVPEPEEKDVQTVSVGVDVSKELGAAIKKRDRERPRKARLVGGSRKEVTERPN